METSCIQQRRQLLAAELHRCLRILQACDPPQRVILFGSLAAGTVHEWSDLDLVVVKETSERFPQRLTAMAQLLQPRVGADILVYTPAEFAQLTQERPFFREEILAKGIVMNGAYHWLQFAIEDRQSAEVLVAAGLYSQACFHAQQCLEKALKALLVQQGQVPPRTHRLTDLLQQLALDWPSDWIERMRQVDALYLSARYPDVSPASHELGESEAQSALALARQVLERVAPELDGSPPS